MEEEFSHEQCREVTYELIQWIVARTMIGYTRPLSERLSQWAIWYLPRHCSHCGACGDDVHRLFLPIRFRLWYTLGLP